jgi:hypothetical protein
MTKKTTFLILGILICSISSFFCTNEKAITNQSIIQKLNECKPVLKEFLNTNNFLEKGANIEDGIVSFMKDFKERQSFKDYIAPPISDKYCKMFGKENLFTEIWYFDSSMTRIGFLGEDIEPNEAVLQVEKRLVTNSEYFTWLKNHQNEQQPIVSEMIHIRIYEDMHFTSSTLLKGLSKSKDVNYSDEVLHAMIIAELLIDVIAFNCS